MKFAMRGLCGLLSVLAFQEAALAQAGRFIPPIRVPTGGFRMPITPFPNLGVGGDILVIILFVGLLVVLGFAGWYLGRFLGRVRETHLGSRVRETHRRRNGAFHAPYNGAFHARDEDLILNPFEVEAKAEQTTRLLEFLAYRDRLLDPSLLRRWTTAIFHRVQECWQQRDYAPVKDVLMPKFMAEHKKLLKEMRRCREINKLEGLAVEKLNLVHVHCPVATDEQEVTALITFRAASYYADERTGAYRRGPRDARLFQEFWVFRRQGENWRLSAIERTHISKRLQAENRVDALTEDQLQNAQQAVAL